MKKTLCGAMVFAMCCAAVSASTAGTIKICLWSNGNLHIVSREASSDTTTLNASLYALVQGPTAEERSAGIESAIPTGTMIYEIQPDATSVRIDFSSDIVSEDFNEARLSAIYDQVRYTLRANDIEKEVIMTARGEMLYKYLPPTPVIVPRVELEPFKLPIGGTALSGRRITVSPGHGKVWTGTAYGFQRGITCASTGLPREDDHNLEICQYLEKYLLADGATVKMARCTNKDYGTHAASGEPWWRVCAVNWLEHQGYPCTVWGSTSGCVVGSGASELTDDIRARPLSSDYDATDIYFSLHTNALSGDCTGTGCPTGSDIFYDCSTEHLAWCAVSRTLEEAVYPAMLDAIRSKLPDPTWNNHGVHEDTAGNYGEIRIPDRAAVLLELAYHDTCDRDALALADNFFRSTAMWGIYKGMCTYFGAAPTWDYYSDELVSHDIPSAMAPSETRTVHITYRNRGVLWNQPRGFRLGALGGSDPFTTTLSHAVSVETGPGDTYTFTFNLTAPSTPGTYLTDWQMQRAGYQYFGAVCSRSIVVGGVPDTTPPVISNVAASGLTTSTASVTWTTDDDATSQVDYGLTTSYGSTTTEDTSYVTSHAVLLSGLGSGTTYHYRVRSRNGAGLSTTSGDYTFTTAPAVPGQPAVSVINSSSLSVTNHVSDPSGSYYAFRINDGTACSNKFVQGNGTVGTSPVWQTKSTWGTTAVTGRTSGTSYTFDVAAASSSSGSNATWNVYAGTYVNSPTLGVANKWASGDTAASFNGTSQYVSLPAMGSDVDLSSGFTIECWANPSALSTWYPVLQLTDGASYGTFVNHVCFDMSGTGGMRGEVYQSGGCGSPCMGNYYVSPSLSFSTGSWHHYAMVVNSGGTLTFYKDGVADAGQSLLYMPSSGVTRGKVQIGRRDTSSTYYWHGSLDEVALYDYALTGARLGAHYTAANAALYNTEVVKDNPVAYWRLGESSGTAAADNKGGYSPAASGATSTCTAPVAPTSASASPSTICPGASSTLTAVGGSGTTCQWYTGSCGGTLVGTGTSITVSPTSSTTYYVRWTSSCGSSSCASTSVTVAAPPTISAITPPSGANTGTTSITNLAGTGFLAPATVKLTRTGYSDINATNVVVTSPNQITCSLDLTGKKTGLWNVVVGNQCAQSGMLGSGFGIGIADTSPVVGTSVQALLDSIAVGASGRYRFRVWGIVETIDSASFWLDDGSGTRIKVFAPGYSGITTNSYASAIGTVDVSLGTPVLVTSAGQVTDY